MAPSDVRGGTYTLAQRASRRPVEQNTEMLFTVPCGSLGRHVDAPLDPGSNRPVWNAG